MSRVGVLVAMATMGACGGEMFDEAEVVEQQGLPATYNNRSWGGSDAKAGATAKAKSLGDPQPIAMTCCTSETLYGTADNFALPQDTTYVSPGFNSYLTSVGISAAIRGKFDEPGMDRHFVESLKFGERKEQIDAYCKFGVRLHLKSNGTYDSGSNANNDSAIIMASAGNANSVPIVAQSLGLHPTGVPYDHTFNLKPYSAQIGSKDFIDVRVQDDTSVDYVALVRGKMVPVNMCAISAEPASSLR